MTWDLKWEIAAAIYVGRMREAWGDGWVARSRFPATAKERRAYFHGREVAEVDLALASAEEVMHRFHIDTNKQIGADRGPAVPTAGSEAASVICSEPAPNPGGLS